jgi:hypothetical protein
MSKFDYDYLNLVPRSWRQTIQTYRNEDGRLLAAMCVVDSRSKLKLKTGENLRDLEPFHFGVLGTPLTAEDRQKAGLLEKARGGFWLIEDRGYFHGWLHIGSESFEALWTQVLANVAGAWTISLTIEPVENDTWTGSRVSITDASIHFDLAVQPSPFEQQKTSARRSWFGRS